MFYLAFPHSLPLLEGISTWNLLPKISSAHTKQNKKKNRNPFNSDEDIFKFWLPQLPGRLLLAPPHQLHNVTVEKSSTQSGERTRSEKCVCSSVCLRSSVPETQHTQNKENFGAKEFFFSSNAKCRFVYWYFPLFPIFPSTAWIFNSVHRSVLHTPTFRPLCILFSLIHYSVCLVPKLSGKRRQRRGVQASFTHFGRIRWIIDAGRGEKGHGRVRNERNITGKSGNWTGS